MYMVWVGGHASPIYNVFLHVIYYVGHDQLVWEGHEFTVLLFV